MKHHEAMVGHRPGWRLRALAILCIAGSLPAAHAAAAPTPRAAPPAPAAAPNGAEIAPAMELVIGKSRLIQLPAPIERISVGNPAVADVTLLGNRELYLLGKTLGSTNVILWHKGQPPRIIDVTVNIDTQRLETRLRELMPAESGIKVGSAAESIVLSGEVSGPEKIDQATLIAEAFVRSLNRGLVLPVTSGSGEIAAGTAIRVGEQRMNSQGGAASPSSRVVNLLRVGSPQQVMLEVKIAEVSKTLLDRLDSEFAFGALSKGGWGYAFLNNTLSKTPPQNFFGAGKLWEKKGALLLLDAQKKDGLVKILAEPNIIAISGQEGSFLAGGKVFIPVARTNATTGVPSITLEEKEFGVGLKFTPTVLDGGRINLRVAPEVSELSQTGSPFTSIDGSTSVLPSFTTRRAQTTIQLHDGQSFAIAGLIKNNVTESIKRFPGLGEVPILGALFRSNEFQSDKSELMFVITPRLVKPLPPNYALPTDSFVPPSRAEFFLNGRLEGSAPPIDRQYEEKPDAPQPPRAASAPAAPDVPTLPAPAASVSLEAN